MLCHTYSLLRRMEATLETDFGQTCASGAGASVVERIARQFSNQKIKVESCMNSSTAMSLEKIMNPILNPHTWNCCDVLFVSALVYTKPWMLFLENKLAAKRFRSENVKMWLSTWLSEMNPFTHVKVPFTCQWFTELFDKDSINIPHYFCTGCFIFFCLCIHAACVSIDDIHLLR